MAKQRICIDNVFMKLQFINHEQLLFKYADAGGGRNDSRHQSYWIQQ